MRAMRWAFLALSVVEWTGLDSMAVAWSDKSAPAHLEVAVAFAKHIRADETSYRHKDAVVKWKGIDGATVNECHTDCSGFINALWERTYNLTEDDFKDWLGTHRPVAKSYYQGIIDKKRLQVISRVRDLRPGDLLAIKYLADDPDNKDHNSGHIMLAVSEAKLRKATKPLVDGTEQWEVEIIDESHTGHGPNDTRHREEGKDRSGLGRGVFRLYTNTDGTIAGHCWSASASSSYRSQEYRPLAIGRYEPPAKP
jgi:hypothetical protein